VSVASNVGGGRIVVVASTAKEAAVLGSIRMLTDTKTRRGQKLKPQTIDVIVTDTTIKSGSKAQTFWGEGYGKPVKLPFRDSV
jgi:predicted TIM-barrel enzyme